MPTVTIGLVGCGRMGRAHLQSVAAGSGAAIVAVVDPAVNQPGLPSLSFDELLAGPTAAVLIAAPTPTHARLVRAALEQGKHVLCEKPLTFDPDEDRALGRLAASRGLVLQVGFWRRFAEPYRLLRDVVARGTIGEVKAIRAAQWDAKPPAAEFCDPRISGGLEVDCGVHEFDLAHWLLGAHVEAITACSPPPLPSLAAVGDLDTVFGLARLSHGRAMTVDLSRTAGYRDSIRTELLGSNGSAIVEFTDAGSLTVRHDDRAEVTPFADDVIATALAAQLRAFAIAIASGRANPDSATAADSHRALLAALVLRDARSSPHWRLVT